MESVFGIVNLYMMLSSVGTRHRLLVFSLPAQMASLCQMETAEVRNLKTVVTNGTHQIYLTLKGIGSMIPSLSAPEDACFYLVSLFLQGHYYFLLLKSRFLCSPFHDKQQVAQASIGAGFRFGLHSCLYLD